MFFFFFQAEDGIRDLYVTGVQTCALPISAAPPSRSRSAACRRTACRTWRHRSPRSAVKGARSEERRVGKECRCGWAPRHTKTKEREDYAGLCVQYRASQRGRTRNGYQSPV